MFQFLNYKISGNQLEMAECFQYFIGTTFRVALQNTQSKTAIAVYSNDKTSYEIEINSFQGFL